MNKQKNKFYKQLKIDKKTKEAIKYYNRMKEEMIKEKE